MFNNLLAMSWELYQTLSIICVVLAVLSAIFLIIVVMIQPSNSSGIGALGGQSETFHSKNKSKTLESKMKSLTVITVIVMALFMILFCVIQLFFNF